MKPSDTKAPMIKGERCGDAFYLRTHTGRVVSAEDIDPKFISTASEQQRHAAYFIPIQHDGQVCVGFSVGAETTELTFLSTLLIVEIELDRFAVRRCKDELYLSENPHTGQTDFSRTEAGGWELFTLSAVEAQTSKRLTSNSGLFADVRGSSIEDTTERLLESDLPHSKSMLYNIMGSIFQIFLRKVQSRLVFSSRYDQVYDFIKTNLIGDRQHFEYLTRIMLKDQVQQHGWVIGDHSYGAPTIFEPDLGKLSIGRFCSMNQFVVILGNHKVSNVTTYPFRALKEFWPSAQNDDTLEDHTANDVEIGSDVWIGNGALILPGTVIGHGSIIGAHAVARGNIPPYSIVVGNPGKVVRRRFPDAVIAEMLTIRWWEWPDYKVDQAIHLLAKDDMSSFIERFGSAQGAKSAPAS